MSSGEIASHFLQTEHERRTRANISADRFLRERPAQPKFKIGQYVADQGFPVPLITDQKEWEQAFDEGNAMLRSESWQDYDGLSGLLSSERINTDLSYVRPKVAVSEYNGRMMRLVFEGLRSGMLDPSEYMMYFQGPHQNWTNSAVYTMQSAMYFGIEVDPLEAVTASKWRYVEGTNVTIFADPNVEGRYHFGVQQPKVRHDNKLGHGSIGSYTFDSGEYNVKKRFRKHNKPFVASPFIEFYEQIRNLSAFDPRQCPLLELVQDQAGVIHFLQYFRTHQEVNYTDPFEIPASNDALITTNVRGVTPEDGIEMRLIMHPVRATQAMETSGVYAGLARPGKFELQLASRITPFVLNQAYVSFQNNHSDSSPMFRPPLAAGLDSDGLERTQMSVKERLDNMIDNLGAAAFKLPGDPDSYVDIKITSNGREAVIESDWQVRTDE